MSKKEIIITIIIGVICIILSFLVTYSILNKNSIENHPTKPNSNTKEVLQVGKYTLKYGTYKGIEKEYNPDTNKVEEKN